MHPLRGLTSAQEQDSSRLIRDTRSLGQRFSQDFIKNPPAVALGIGLLAISCYWFGAIFDFIFLCVRLC